MIPNTIPPSLQRYMPYTRAAIGVGSLPNGTAYYKSLLRWHLSMDIDPEDVHAIGLKEVARIKIEMEKVNLFSWLLSYFLTDII